MDRQVTIDTFNTLLRGEISAVETYRIACDKLKNSTHYSVLADNLTSHERRVQRIRDHLFQLGGQPSEGSGVWGAFSRLWQGGASMLGDAPAIAALEEGEDEGVRDYRDALADTANLDPQCVQFINDELLPEQNRTHAALSRLKHLVSA